MIHVFFQTILPLQCVLLAANHKQPQQQHIINKIKGQQNTAKVKTLPKNPKQEEQNHTKTLTSKTQNAPVKTRKQVEVC